MIPVVKIPSNATAAMLLYVSVIGLLLVIATIIRLKVSFFRKAFIPASLIAGFIGLALGPYALNIIPQTIVGSMGTLPGQLICIVFATMFLGYSHGEKLDKGTVHDSAAMLIWTWMGGCLQFAIPCLVTAVLFTPLMGVNPMFGSVIEIGFDGGHGTAGGMAGIFRDAAALNWPDGADLGMTTATIGLLVGIFGGIALINYAVRKKYTAVSTEPVSLGEVVEVFKGNNKPVAAYVTISKDVVDSFAFHFGVIGIAILIGKIIVSLITQALHMKGLPLFPFTMLGGWIINYIFYKLGLGDLLDRKSFEKISGMALEILIVAAISTIKIPIVLAYWLPLLVTSVLTTICVIMTVMYICPYIYKTAWFEKGIIQFGVKTGVAAIGYMLLRTADPDWETDSGKTYALSTPLSSPFIGGGLVTTAVPYLIKGIGAMEVGLIFAGIALVLFAVLRFFFWDKNAVKVQRS